MIKLCGPDTRVLDLQSCPNRATEHPTLNIDSNYLSRGHTSTCWSHLCTPWMALGRTQTTDARVLGRPSSSAIRALIISRRTHASCPGPSRFTVPPELSPETNHSGALSCSSLRPVLPVIAVRCYTDARPAALGGHEISLVIAIDACLFAKSSTRPESTALRSRCSAKP